jgi:hypothetical protein
MTVLPFEHADEAAAALRELVAEQGPGILSDPLMLGSLLADLLPAAPSAVRILVAAAEDHVANTISDNVSQGIGADAAVRMAASSFARTSLSAPEVSQWVATAFATASGLQVGPPVQSSPAGFSSGGQQNFYNPASPSGQQNQAPAAPSWPVAGQNAPTMGPQPRLSPGNSGFQTGGGAPSGPPPVSPPVPPPFAYQQYQQYQPQPYQVSGQQFPAQKQQFAPKPVLNAVKLMYGGIALSVVLAITDFAETGKLGSYAYLTSHQSATAFASAVGAFMSLLGIGLWILLAWANRKGMTWARIVATILFAIFVLYTVVSITTVIPVAIVVELGTLAVGLIALLFIWRGESSAYYQLSGQPPVR